MLATLEWLWWFNHLRLFAPIGYVPPVEYEKLHYPSEKASEVLTTLNSGALR